MSVFANAKTLKPAAKPKKDAAEKIDVEGMEQLAALDYLIKTFTALKATVEADVKGAVLNQFIATGSQTKTRPANFKGVENDAIGSCQLKAKSSAVAVTAEEIPVLATAGIVPVEVETTVETFIINPKYKDDQKVLGAVDKALKKIKDLPEDFILAQEGVSKKVLPDLAIETLFATGDADKIRTVLPQVSTLAVAPKFASEVSVADAFGLIENLISVTVEE